MLNFKKLKVWQKAMDLAVNVYELILAMPSEEQFALTSQIKRSAVSIPSNVAEGAGRFSNKELARFLDISNGSSNELETQLILAERVGLLKEGELKDTFLKLEEIQKMNFG